ncbi:MAG: hypothetical protein ACQCN6_01920 [Candidatus Bathyarchaeia archaeon]
MSHKNLAIGSIAVLVSLLAVMVFVATCSSALQAINPFAALTAVAVAVIGLAWFKKSSN